jgi:CO dehydrogenase maturation factor
MSIEKGKYIVVTGRGGSGKSSFTALSTRCLGELGWKPILVVDSDPDESLSYMLGIDLGEEAKRTVSEMLFEIIEERKMAKMVGMSASDKIEPFLFQNTLYEGAGFFDFIALGTKWSEGCYCLPDHALSQIMERWARNYDFVVIDSPAGVEHLNRKIAKKVKDVFNILDPSKKSFDNAERTYKLMTEVGIEFENYFLVGGYRFPEKLEEEAESQPYEYLGRISFDEMLEDFNLQGRSLMELPRENLAYASVKKILEKARYTEKPLQVSDILKQKS